ncbi:hypothetical protein B7463_g11677, partial [Scytalidium lignicola]
MQPRNVSIAVSHPAGGVKEQTAGLYANRLSAEGFITLAWDAAYGGESEGLPRGLEDPTQRIEDIKNAISFLSVHPRVVPERIGLLGICASGGYVTVAAGVDRRIKATATVSGADIGVFFRQGYNGQQDPSILQTMLDNAARARTAAALGREMEGFPLFPPSETAARKLSQYVYEGWEYYMTPRAFNPRSAKTMPWNSVDKLAGFDGFTRISAISPRPILIIVGEKADTKWMAEQAFPNAGEPKELFWIPGASHVDLYDKDQYVTPAVARMTDYFRQYLLA